MLNYFARRLLLVPITFLAITLMVYAILRWAPGGPIEQLEAQLQGMSGEVAGGAAGPEASALDEDAKEELRRYYNLDKPIPIGYLQWLGALPKTKERAVPLEERGQDPVFWKEAERLLKEHADATEKLEGELTSTKWTELDESSLYRPIPASVREADPPYFAEADELLSAGVPRRRALNQHLAKRGYRLVDTEYYAPATDGLSSVEQQTRDKLVGLQTTREQTRSKLDEYLETQSYAVSRTLNFIHQERKFSGILQGDFGNSFQYNKSALDVIVSKFPISIFLGLIGYFSAWIVCIPLGVWKAIRHRSHFDTASSVAVFIGYSTPGWVACLLLLIYLGGGSYFDLVPLGGFRSPDWDIWWENGEYWRCIKDQCHHMAVPVFGYLMANFAAMTILMKNSLLENLGADYVRTAFAKGLPERRVILVHTLRNSMIPITAGVGHTIGLIFAGSFLIEKTCNIPGMGLLGFNAILQRDFPIILGTLVFLVLVRLLGNIISDVIWAMIDPRIRFK